LVPADDAAKGASPHIVLSYAFWRKRFGGDSSVLNRVIDINGHPMTVVGVAPVQFRGADVANAADVFVPIAMKANVTPTWDGMQERGYSWLNIIARLKPGVSLKQAQAQADLVYRQEQRLDLKLNPFLAGESEKEYLKNKFVLLSAAKGFSRIRDKFSAPIIVLMIMVGTLLLISCGNMANLLMARAAARQKEVAVRLSLGASAGAIVRLVMAESLILSTAGGAVALGACAWSSALLLNILPFETFSNVITTDIDTRMVLFTFGVSLVTAVVFGLFPAIQAAKPDLVDTLKGESRSVAGGHLRFRKGMVAAQIAMSLVLLIGAGLFARSLYNLMRTDSGMRVEHLLSFSIEPSLAGYSDQRTRTLMETAQSKLEALPGVLAVSGAQNAILSVSQMMSTVRAEGYHAKDHEDVNPVVNAVLPGFFSTLGVPLIGGREFNLRDNFGAPKVAIVNQTFAHYFFGNANPIGRRIGFGDPDKAPLNLEIVGVVKDMKTADLKEGATRQVWTAILQDEKPGRITFYVRSAAGISSLVVMARQAFQQIDPTMPLYRFKTVQTQINETHYVDRLISMFSAAFGILATLLAAIGLYGTIAFAVARRTPELGIRMALGATRRGVLGLVMAEVMRMTVIGIAVAVPVALFLARYLKDQLYEVSTTDGATILTSISTLVIVSLIAGFIPALRATRIDPVTALRWE
jgi:predicted permease